MTQFHPPDKMSPLLTSILEGWFFFKLNITSFYCFFLDLCVEKHSRETDENWIQQQELLKFVSVSVKLHFFKQKKKEIIQHILLYWYTLKYLHLFKCFVEYISTEFFLIVKCSQKGILTIILIFCKITTFSKKK